MIYQPAPTPSPSSERLDVDSFLIGGLLTAGLILGAMVLVAILAPYLNIPVALCQ